MLEVNVPAPSQSPSSEVKAPGALTLAGPRVYGVATALVVLLFVAVELVIIGRNGTGPSFDESIYITAGVRTWQGHGLGDGYLTWFAGSLLWPLLAGAGYSAAGLAGARIVALVCVTIALAATARATHNLFGVRAAFWATLALALSGPVLALAHLAVYDTLSLAGMGLSLWTVTEGARRDNRIWTVAAALAFSLAVLAKYPMVLCLLPLLALIVALRGRKAPTDVAMFGYVGLAILLAYYLPLREPLSGLLAWRAANNPTFGVTSDMLRYTVLLLTLPPCLLAACGWALCHSSAARWLPLPQLDGRSAWEGLLGRPGAGRERRRVATVLLAALFLWPLYHLMTNNIVSFSKHVVFGYLFAYPLVGVALAAAERRARRGHHVLRVRVWAARAVLVGVGMTVGILALIGSAQAQQADEGWPDVRAAAAYLVAHVRPGARLLINDSWPYTQYLYLNRRIGSPWSVYDLYRLQHGQSPVGICGYTWVVDEEGSYAWPAGVRAALAACRTYRPVFTTTAYVSNMGRSLAVVRYPVHTIIWRRVTAPSRHGELFGVVVY